MVILLAEFQIRDLGGNSDAKGMKRRQVQVIGIDMYTLMCIKLMTNKNLQYKKTNKQIKTTNTKLSLGYWCGNMFI